MDVRLTTEQQQLRDAAAKLADDLGPATVQDLDDQNRITRLDKQIESTGWRSLRSDGASGVEVAIVAEELGRRLVDTPFLGPVLADDLGRHIGEDASGTTVAVDDRVIDARGARRALALSGGAVSAVDVQALTDGVDLTRAEATIVGSPVALGEVSPEVAEQWRALALVTTTADLVGVARGAHAVACDYAKIREQYGKQIGSYQAIAHLLAESLALIEGSVSVLRHAAWAVDELAPAEAIRAAQIAKVYCARATRTVCETAIQVHGGIGNTWECVAHVYLRRALTSTELWPVALKEIDLGLS
ncbi:MULTISPECIES: acyl-CoA dehydrogenase family protein [Mycobacterium]|jgi:alkylation response protein AidB-like acyl-CoA dehydrogenase|uniref:Acyl-CoA dehydrogenase n=2 Tax=Mycobacterium avium complex (MAC) TaxID=120793 RepID=A0A7I9Z0G6_9MYCO|nr:MULTISPECIES: acyl-CoA dehydrogenase family protein [Mycobacterium]AFC52247.1 acyl-CoA dehydrogenase domain-containing protein [Mycobacterium paraintracellulare]ASW99208.1 acyl-CoA dehydrogenase [Mycobacterium intracellulare subsp. chimaera]ELR83613.1 acyl-CoA dehydrogenase domain-containing protein [Mycobacterium sp. H4Y]OSC29557.1 acyl-CoA dehydrogenase [Mycobacterium paraintracellulare]PBA53958.1 acyl-CoA dehydrogenase [Mycobacterium intracellulare subsp. chimaera]